LATGSNLVFDGNNLGIGTSSPSSPLSISTSNGGIVSLNSTNTNGGYLGIQKSGTAVGYIGSAAQLSGGSATDMTLRADTNLIFTSNGSSERMRLNTSGYLGIGTSSPAYPLDVQVASGNIYSQILTAGNGTRAGAYYTSKSSGGTTTTLVVSAQGYDGNAQIYTSTNHPLDFSTNNAGTQLRLDTSGNLGLGVTPSAWYSTNSSVAQVRQASFYAVDNSALEIANNAYLTSGGSTWNYINTGYATRYNSSSGKHIWYNAPSSSGAITFTQAMTLDNNGSLAIGGTTVVTNNGGITATTTSSGSIAASLAMRNAGTANGSGTQLVFRGVTNTGAENDYGYLTMVADDTTAKTGSIRFSTGNGSSPAERMRIDSSGRLLLGITTFGASGGSYFQSIANGAVNFGIDIKNTSSTTTTYVTFTNSSNAQAGSITQTGATSVNYGSGSDYRLKENIQPMIGALNIVAQLKPVTFDWIADKTNGQGFIAHELQDIVPDCVVGEKDAIDAQGNPKYQMVDTSKLIATLTAAIQELSAKVTALEAKLGV
jgi:hypothetical protein